MVTEVAVADAAEELDILFQDEALLVLDKPSGLLSVPGRSPQHKDSLALRAQRWFEGARTVHRLDWETSGVSVLALDADVHRELSRQFHDREVEKSYIAIVAGHVYPDEGEVALPLICDWPNRPKQMVDHENGRHALTRWQVIYREIDRTWMRLRPITGRSHQLRVHMQALGHPILGDRLYADLEALHMADRLQLHAERLAVTHPQSGERVTFYSPSPF
ncbi:pseudouridine synthase [Acanthopleuribacter pedis]|uniref:RNA pseudouridine synthase n=1 Tax=Acanthopleuribacter pedis TaxID=442870 RepID=A0A8J7U0C6_9BACT|nr:pseudouridine synthase [Acanthopleuribacter pedis]MBO1316938.1 RNA pseudouridine synthase [Acanthopleuribacter pedis]